MTISRETLERTKTEFVGSSWALWSDRFPNEGCLEENSERLAKFIEARRQHLSPDVVFLSLNPSGEVPRGFSNFHSPKAKHYDDRLKSFVQDNGLESLQGAYMTDLVPEIVDPNSGNVDPSNADVEQFLAELDAFDEPTHHVICLTGKSFEALRGHFGKDATEETHNIESFSVTTGAKTLHVYRVWFYGLYGIYQDKVNELEQQLAYLDRERIK